MGFSLPGFFQDPLKSVSDTLADTEKKVSGTLADTEKGASQAVHDTFGGGEKAVSSWLAKNDPSTNQQARRDLFDAGQSRLWGEGAHDAATHASRSIAGSPVAQLVVSAVCAYFGVPPSVTMGAMAALAANQIANGADENTVIRGLITNYATQYAAGALDSSAMAAMKDSGLSPAQLKAASTLASSTGAGAIKSAVTGKDILEGAGEGFKTGAINAAAGYAGDQAAGASGSKTAGKAVTTLAKTGLQGGNISTAASNYLKDAAGNYLKDTAGNYISDAAKTAGLDSLNIDGVNIQGTQGNIIPGVSSTNAKQLLALTPGGQQVITTAADAKNKLTTALDPNADKAADTSSGSIDTRKLLALLARSQGTPVSVPTTAKEEPKVESSDDLMAFLDTQGSSASPTQSVAHLLGLDQRKLI